MWRVLSVIVVGLLVVVGVFAYANNVFGASPPAQTKGESGVQVPQKAGGQTVPGTPAGQARQAGTGRVVSTAPVAEGKVSLTFTYSGTIQPRVQISVSPRTAGRIEKILVDVGSEVKEGDPLVLLERAALQLSLQQAEANLRSAEARLSTVMAGGRAEDIASATAALASARARLSQVRNGATPADLQAAQSAVESARASLESAKANLASAEARQEVTKAGATPADMAKAQADVDSATATLKTAETRLNQIKSGPTVSELQAAQASVADAKGKLLTAQDTYETALENFSQVASKVTSVSHAAQNVQAAQATYDSAVQKLNQLQAGATAVDFQSAQSAYDSAKATLDSHTARLDQLKRGPTEQELRQAQSTVDAARATLATAQANLATAEARLAQVQRGPTEEELTIAESTVIQAEQTLALRRSPYTSQDLQTAQSAVEVARVALAVAQANLADATLVAPFPGIVTARSLAVGSMATTQSAVVTLASSEAEIAVYVEEARLSRLKPGLPVSLAVPAYPGETFSATVLSIAPTADSRSHTFAMKVATNNPESRLKPGMFAEVRVTAEQREAVLVPRDAVVQRAGKNVVFVVVDGRAQMREVVQGLPQEDNFEIVSGVKAGEQVIVVGHSGLNDGDQVRPTGGGAGQQPGQPQQQSGQPQQQRQSPPAKSQQ